MEYTSILFYCQHKQRFVITYIYFKVNIQGLQEDRESKFWRRLQLVALAKGLSKAVHETQEFLREENTNQPRRMVILFLTSGIHVVSYLRCTAAFPFDRIKFFGGIFSSVLRADILNEGNR
jgi:hypothetical protein